MTYIEIFYSDDTSKKYCFKTFEAADWFAHNEGDHVVIVEIQHPTTIEEEKEYKEIT